MLMQYMYLEAEVSLIGIFVLAMVVKEIIVVASYILLNHVLLRVNRKRQILRLPLNLTPLL